MTNEQELRAQKDELLEWFRGKVDAAKQSVKMRAEMETVWRGGTDKSWRAVGCTSSKSERIKRADLHGLILVKLKREVVMFEIALAHLSQHLFSGGKD